MNEILKAIAADPNVSAEFRAALPVGHTPLELELLAVLQKIADQEQYHDRNAETHMADMADIARAAITKATT